MYDYLFTKDDPDDVEEGEDFMANLNPDSLTILTDVKVEPNLADTTAGDRFQFMRKGYFCTDPDSIDGTLVFNQTVSLRDSWAKIQRQ